MRERLLEHGEHPHPRRAGRVERAALDERLERALVDDLRVDALGELPDRRERPALVAGGDDLAAAASPTFFTAFSPKRIFPSTTAKSTCDELTSGGSTSIPISSHALT